MEDFNRIGKELDGVLRTRTTPLGIKYFEDESDVPRDGRKGVV